MVASMLAFGKPCFRNVYMHGFVQDSQGRKMSKSLGNYILPEEVIKDYGADTLRYYMIGGANPGIDINYNFEDVRLKHKNMFVFWNLHNFIIDMSKNIGKNPEKIDPKIAESLFSTEEKYIMSRLNSTIKDVSETFDSYRLNEVPLKVESLLMDLSRTYIQIVRERASTGDKEEKEVVLYAIYRVFMESLKMLAPVAPFISEQMFLDFKEEFGLVEESIHLFDWPKADESMIDKEVEEMMDASSRIIQAVLAAREKVQLGVRWPMKEVVIVTKDKAAIDAVNGMESIIKSQSNVKEIIVKERMKEVRSKVRADFGRLGPVFGNETPSIIAKLSTESAENIISSIQKKGKLEIEVNGKKVEILKDFLIIEREVPKPYTEMEFRGGVVYINSERTEELEAEGYAREIMRRIQSLRKKAGLQKPDRIVLFVKCDEEMEPLISGWQQAIGEKCGAEKIKVSHESPARKHKVESAEKVKGKEFSIFFDKI